jgi:hypothetical protein
MQRRKRAVLRDDAAMKTTFDHHYDADLETVFQLITDPDFIETKYVALGGKDVAVDKSETDEGGCEVVSRRTLAVELPGFAKKVIQPTQTAVQTEVWAAAQVDGSRVCTYHVEAQGAPGRISGRHTLTPAPGGGTDHHIETEINVTVPLIGGKLEGLARDTARGDLEAQFAYTDKALAAG